MEGKLLLSSPLFAPHLHVIRHRLMSIDSLLRVLMMKGKVIVDEMAHFYAVTLMRIPLLLLTFAFLRT